MPFVRPYVRSDGTPVRGHSRWAPGARREMTIVAVLGLAVLGLGNAQTANGTSSTERHPSVTYPVRFDRPTGGAPRVAVPRPSVSYPIRLDHTPATQRARPTPDVSYPVDISALGSGR